MKNFIIFMIAFVAYGCGKNIEPSVNIINASKTEFNLKTLKRFSQERANYERIANNKIASVGRVSGTHISYNDLLLWDLAIKERNVKTKRHSYLIPIKGSTVNSYLVDTIASKGYSVIDFFTDSKTSTKVYAQVREYRPNTDWIKKLSTQKGLSI